MVAGMRPKLYEGWGITQFSSAPSKGHLFPKTDASEFWLSIYALLSDFAAFGNSFRLTVWPSQSRILLPVIAQLIANSLISGAIYA
jgi:hypothetical protein